MDNTSPLLFPKVSSFYILLQVLIAIFLGMEYYGVKESQVAVSVSKVLKDGEYWRLLLAHLCNFHRVPLLVNSLGLFTIGRYLERRVQKFALSITIMFIGIVSNILFLCFNDYLCSEEMNMEQSGFNSILYATRLWLAYLQEPLNYEASLLYGFWACDLPTIWAPWPLFLEVLLMRAFDSSYCMTNSVCGLAIGAFLSWGMWKVPLNKWLINEVEPKEEDDGDDPGPFLPDESTDQGKQQQERNNSEPKLQVINRKPPQARVQNQNYRNPGDQGPNYRQGASKPIKVEDRPKKSSSGSFYKSLVFVKSHAVKQLIENTKPFPYEKYRALLRAESDDGVIRKRPIESLLVYER